MYVLWREVHLGKKNREWLGLQLRRPEVEEEGSDAKSIPQRYNRRCKGPEAEECLPFSRDNKTVLMKLRTYI